MPSSAATCRAATWVFLRRGSSLAQRSRSVVRAVAWHLGRAGLAAAGRRGRPRDRGHRAAGRPHRVPQTRPVRPARFQRRIGELRPRPQAGPEGARESAAAAWYRQTSSRSRARRVSNSPVGLGAAAPNGRRSHPNPGWMRLQRPRRPAPTLPEGGPGRETRGRTHRGTARTRAGGGGRRRHHRLQRRLPPGSTRGHRRAGARAGPAHRWHHLARRGAGLAAEVQPQPDAAGDLLGAAVRVARAGQRPRHRLPHQRIDLGRLRPRPLRGAAAWAVDGPHGRGEGPGARVRRTARAVAAAAHRRPRRRDPPARCATRATTPTARRRPAS